MASRSGGSKPSYLKNKNVDDDGINMDEDLSGDDGKTSVVVLTVVL